MKEGDIEFYNDYEETLHKVRILDLCRDELSEDQFRDLKMKKLMLIQNLDRYINLVPEVDAGRIKT